MNKILPFEERLALLEKALSKHSPESLLAELQKYPAVGPSIVDFMPCEKLKELKNKKEH